MRGIHRRRLVEVFRVSDIEPSEVNVGRRSTSDKFAQEHSDVASPSHVRVEREGLPASYRMRADAHYVEQLTSRRERAERLDTARHVNGAADMTDREATPERRDRRSDRVMAQLEEEIAAIASAATMLTSDVSPLARRMSLDLVRSQAWRAAWLLRASALLDGRHRGQIRSRAVGTILEQIRQGLAPECRLAGASLHLQASDWNAVVSVDEAALVAGVTAGVFATLSLAGSFDTMAVRVAFDVTGAEIRQVEIAQDEIAAVSSANLRFFDPTWGDRPGGWSAGIAALAVRSAAQQLGGSAVFLPGERRGTVVRLNLARV
jgi:hypothetical protein